MATTSRIVTKLQIRLSDARVRRQRHDLMARIGELTYAHRIDHATSHDTAIDELVEQVRHLDRMQELRHRRDISQVD